MSVLGVLKRRLYPLYTRYFARAYLYQGELRSGKGEAKCLFIDNDQFYLGVVAKLFSEHYTLIRTFRCLISGVPHLMGSTKLDADVCFVNVAQRHASLFETRAIFKMQTRVSQSLDLIDAGENNKRFRDARKRVQKKLKKSGLTYRITREEEDFKFFYHRMSKPLVKKFGDAAMEMSYMDMKSVFEQGLLMFIQYNGEPVAGLVCVEQYPTIVSYRLGVLDGDQYYTEMGAQAACYYFLFEYASQQGFQQVDFMRCLPFLNDGVYVHKRLWGAQVGPYAEASSWVYLFKCSDALSFYRVMENLFPIVHTDQGLFGVVPVGGEAGLTTAMQHEMIRQYGDPGLSGLYIITESGKTERMLFAERHASIVA
jgi:hypothetical protein